MFRKDLISLFSVFIFCIFSLTISSVSAWGQISINEIRIDQPSTDNDEYFELIGAPNTSLDGLTYLVIGDGSGASGVIENVTDLSGLSLDSNGFFVAAESSFTLGTADLITTLNFENSDNVTHLIVEGFTGSDGDDLDTDDNGSLDATPWSSVVDLIALVEELNPPAGTEFHYGPPAVGPDGSFVPGHVFRCEDETGDFEIGQFDPAGGQDTPGDENACDVIPPDAIEATIMQIQGAGHTSLLDGQNVITNGIVTAVDTNGFYLQDPVGDSDIATSDAIFVFTGSAPVVNVGDDVDVEGIVSEFFPGGTSTGNLSTTQISGSPVITANSTGNSLPTAIFIGSSGRIPPSENIDDDAFTSFDPETDGIDFFESLEAMLVTVESPLAVSGTNRFGEIFTVVNDGANATGLSSRNTLNISPDDFNPEKVQINQDSGILPGFDFPFVDTADQLSNVTGVVGYSFGNFEVFPTVPFTFTLGNLEPEFSEIASGENRLTVASYNVLNLDPNDSDGDTDLADGRFEALANQIVINLNSPDIIGLQEVQDNSGSANDGTISADATLQELVDRIALSGGPTYKFIDNTFIGNETSGGQPGGNIRTAFLFNPDRVSVVLGSVQSIENGDQQTNPLNPFFGSRLPLVATFEFKGEEILVVNNHFSSKGGSAPILGVEQPFETRQEDVTVNGSLDERQAQAAAIRDFVIGLNPDANIIVLGDLNEFEFVSPVAQLLRDEANLVNLVETLPDNERYSFIFQGNSQALDHILISQSLLDRNPEFEVVHTNSEFAETDQRASDHDPSLASFEFSCPTIEELIDEIEKSRIEGEISFSISVRLIKPLERAQFFFNKGKIQQTENFLNKFIRTVEKFISKDQLDSETGVNLIESAMCILD